MLAQIRYYCKCATSRTSVVLVGILGTLIATCSAGIQIAIVSFGAMQTQGHESIYLVQIDSGRRNAGIAYIAEVYEGRLYSEMHGSIAVQIRPEWEPIFFSSSDRSAAAERSRRAASTIALMSGLDLQRIDPHIYAARTIGWPLRFIAGNWTTEHARHGEEAHLIVSGTKVANSLPTTYISMSFSRNSAGYPTVWIPTRLYWFRLVLFLAFWIILTYTMIFVVRTLVSIHRHHIGQCSKCGFPVASDSAIRCPECGIEHYQAV